jgi:hypothetical protein
MAKSRRIRNNKNLKRTSGGASRTRRQSAGAPEDWADGPINQGKVDPDSTNFLSFKAKKDLDANDITELLSLQQMKGILEGITKDTFTTIVVHKGKSKSPPSQLPTLEPTPAQGQVEVAAVAAADAGPRRPAENN